MATSKRLDAKNIKKAMNNYGIKAVRCVQGKGSQRNAALIVVKLEDIEATKSFFNEFGIVNVMGKPHKSPTSYKYAEFSPAYLSLGMAKEL